MTTVYDTQAEGPATHLLAIGVGEYPHLRDGTGPRHGEHLRLGQLRSPPVSAKRLAEWMIESLDNTPPLGTVEVVTSPPTTVDPGNGEYSTEVERATFANIKEAFNRWYNRCAEHPENVAFFYFCGHGVELDKLALLAEDFYADENEPFQTAIDFQGTHRGMAGCAAQTQVVIADACREVAPQLVDPAYFSPRALKLPRGGHSGDSPRLYATGPGSRAWAREGGHPTEFVEALIDALNGEVSRPDRRGRWKVTTASLIEGLSSALARRAERGAPKQDAHLDSECKGTGIVSRPEPPLVPALICCKPRVAAGSALLQLDDGTVYRRAEPPVPQDWELEVRAGGYRARAIFPNGDAGYRDCEESLLAMPPEGGEVELEVGR
jgi:Caspase domain